MVFLITLTLDDAASDEIYCPNNWNWLKRNKDGFRYNICMLQLQLKFTRLQRQLQPAQSRSNPASEFEISLLNLREPTPF